MPNRSDILRKLAAATAADIIPTDDDEANMFSLFVVL
jgi:hypothetical protein